MGYGIDNKNRRLEQEKLLHFGAPQDLRSFGLIPEIIGRLPILTNLEALDRAALKRILSEPKNAITKQYVKLFDMDNVKLTINDDVLDYVVDKAIEYKLGARGLRSIFETIMMDAMYLIPSSAKKKYTVTLDYAREQLEKSNMEMLKDA